MQHDSEIQKLFYQSTSCLEKHALGAKISTNKIDVLEFDLDVKNARSVFCSPQNWLLGRTQIRREGHCELPGGFNAVRYNAEEPTLEQLSFLVLRTCKGMGYEINTLG